MTNPIAAAYTYNANSRLDRDALKEQHARAIILVKEDPDEVEGEDYASTPYPAIWSGGSIFVYDAADTTTAHDGLTCLVSSDGRRYKATAQTYVKYRVDDKDTAAQPESPAINDAYLLPAAPTGDDWSSKAKHVAVYSARGWVFYAPVAGDIAFVEDEGVFYHYSSGGVWTLGLADLGLTASSVGTTHLQKPFGYKVEDVSNTPPTLPGAGVAYIIGTSPTGAWEGEASKIAESNGASWDIYTVAEGDLVYDKAAGYTKAFKSGVWVREVPAPAVLSSTAPVALSGGSTAAAWLQIATFGNRTISNAANKWHIDLRAYIKNSDATYDFNNLEIGVFFDSEATPRASVVRRSHNASTNLGNDYNFYSELFSVAPADAGEHAIHVKIRRNAGPTPASYTCGGGTATLREVTET